MHVLGNSTLPINAANKANTTHKSENQFWCLAEIFNAMSE